MSNIFKSKPKEKKDVGKLLKIAMEKSPKPSSQPCTSGTSKHDKSKSENNNTNNNTARKTINAQVDSNNKIAKTTRTSNAPDLVLSNTIDESDNNKKVLPWKMNKIKLVAEYALIVMRMMDDHHERTKNILMKMANEVSLNNNKIIKVQEELLQTLIKTLEVNRKRNRN